MLSGLKFIPRDQLDTAGNEHLDDSRRSEKKGKKKDRQKKRGSKYSSSEEDDLDRIEKRSRKKWYSSDEDAASPSGSGSDSPSDHDEKSQRHSKKEKKTRRSRSRDKSRKKSRSKRDEHSSGDSSESNSEREGNGFSTREDKYRKGSKSLTSKKGSARGDIGLPADGEGSMSSNKNDVVRKELGLDWMLRPKDNLEGKILTTTDELEEPKAEEMKKEHPRELNPFLKDNGSGYPEEANGSKPEKGQSRSSAVVGDGGASWRLKALKRAQEQAAREGRNLNEVVEERWESLGQLSVSLTSRKAAPSRAHLHAIKNRQKGQIEEQADADDQTEKVTEKNSGRVSRHDVSRRYHDVKVPKVHDSLSWGKRKNQNMSSKDSRLISTAISSINKFANDGSFMHELSREPVGFSSKNYEFKVDAELVSSESRQASESGGIIIDGLSANQVAAKALQLRLKGKHEEADSLLKEAENIKEKQAAGDVSCRPQKGSNTRSYVTHETSIRQRKSADDGDAHLAQKIAQNKRYSMSSSNQADDEYDFDDGPRRKGRKKGGTESRSNEKPNFPKRFLTQQERCHFCFENPNRPRHLVIAIANFTYLSLPHWQPVVPGHCCILTLQHESATRAVDDNVWDEIRNFKKCVIMMFAKQEMDVVFLETVMGLAQQRRHCMVEVIPLPQATAKAAPLYFKKAIDEAEDEWSQHNAKKLIDTSKKGLRGSIPKDFPYFYVEFGLNKGFVHIIDDETQFKSNFGLNVIRGMMQLPEEDMYGRRKQDSLESQKQAAANFAKDWQPFDWTKQLG